MTTARHERTRSLITLEFSRPFEVLTELRVPLGLLKARIEDINPSTSSALDTTNPNFEQPNNQRKLQSPLYHFLNHFKFINNKMSLLRYSDLFSLLDETARGPRHTNRRGAFSPSFDVHETEQAYVLEGEFPGLHDKSSLNIEFTDPQTLLVRGKTERAHHESSDGTESTVTKKDAKEGKSTTEEKDSKPRYWVSERTVGEFQRSFSFPSYVDVDAVKASLAHGILKIVVPKKQSQIVKNIEIS